MGNCLTRYDPKVHSCQPNGPPESYKVPPSSPAVRNFARKELHCSSDGPASQRKAQRKEPHGTPSSHAADPTKVSFLDLPPELRNKIYAYLFILPDNSVRLTRENRTKLPSLALLRTCKQIHDEAASVFYSGNSFYCTVERHVALHTYQVHPHPEVHARPEVYGPPDPNAAVWLHKWEYSKTPIFSDYHPRTRGYNQAVEKTHRDIQSEFAPSKLVEELNVPALRYHRWLTRLTVDLVLGIRVNSPEDRQILFLHSHLQRVWYPEIDILEQAMFAEQVRMQEELITVLCQMYETMQAEWTGKETGWDGRIVIAPDRINRTFYVNTTRDMRATVSFAEREEHERVTMGYWKKCSNDLG